MSTNGGPSAGWYPDPSMAGTQRYWDGSRWSDHVAPMAASQPRRSTEAEDVSGLVVAGVITSIIIPIIGFIIGIVLMAKNKPGPGLACLILSIVAFFGWAAVLSSSGGY